MMDIVVDACCLINLAAGEVLPASAVKMKRSKKPTFPCMLHIPEIVAKEALYVLQPDPDDPASLVRSPIDLSALREQRLLLGCEIESNEESSLFVQLAIRLDDGEAAALAIARHRSWTLATDDRVAANLAGELSVSVLNTAQLLKMWAVHTSANGQLIHEIIHRIQTYAKFAPRRDSLEFEWWKRHAESKGKTKHSDRQE